MIIALLLAAAAVLTLVLLWRVARGQAAAIHSVEELLTSIRPVDLEAFRNLTDPAEAAYLRAHLPAAEFRRVQRSRLRSATEYVQRTAHNAALLLSMAQWVRHDDNAEVARSAAQLVEGAVRLRLFSMLALTLLYLQRLLPGLPIRISDMFARYAQVRQQLLYLSRLQAPTLASRVEGLL